MAVNRAVASSVGRVPGRALALGLPDLRSVEQRRDDRRRADSDRYARLHQLGPSLLVSPIIVRAAAVAHWVLAFVLVLRPYAQQPNLGRLVACAAV